MQKKRIVPLLFAAVLLAACGEETRNGQLTLAGSQPVRVIDQSGAVMQFVTGPLKVTFGAESRSKFTAELEQNGRKAKFSGAMPAYSDWNFTVRGRDIGQPVDLASTRSVALHGPTRTTWGMGGPCGFNGQWETEETWQQGTEDWKVAFNDAQTGAALGAFASRTEQSVLLGTRDVWCRERPMPEPRYPRYPDYPRDPGRGRRLEAVSQKLGNIVPADVNFDSSK